jgi:hypothetical protein
MPLYRALARDKRRTVQLSLPCNTLPSLSPVVSAPAPLANSSTKSATPIERAKPVIVIPLSTISSGVRPNIRSLTLFLPIVTRTGAAALQRNVTAVFDDETSAQGCIHSIVA